LLANTNPSKPTYVNWAKEQVIQQSDNNIIAKGLVSIAGDTLINNNTTSDNMIFFSIYETNIFGKKVKVLGILGNFYPVENTAIKNTKSYDDEYSIGLGVTG